MAELPGGSLGLAKAVFLRLVTPERTRAMVTLSELSELVAQPAERAALSQLVDRLVHARLLVVQTDTRSTGVTPGGASAGAAPGATVELVHESLIQTWPVLLRWLDEGHGDSVFLTELRQAARQWEARGRPGGLLWRGESVEQARGWMRHYRGALTPLQQEFLQAAFDLEARFARRRRWLVAGVIATLTIMMAAAIVALVLIRDAQKEAVAQAAVARQAEERVREQLARVQAEERARRMAEERERSARQAAERAGVQVEQTNEELARKNQELGQALIHATEARRRADASAAAAEQARAETVRANEQLQRLLESERERVRRLENQGGTMVREVPRRPFPGRPRGACSRAGIPAPPGRGLDPTPGRSRVPGRGLDPTPGRSRVPGRGLDPTPGRSRVPGRGLDPTPGRSRVPGRGLDPTPGRSRVPGRGLDPTPGRSRVPDRGLDPTPGRSRAPLPDIEVAAEGRVVHDAAHRATTWTAPGALGCGPA